MNAFRAHLLMSGDLQLCPRKAPAVVMTCHVDTHGKGKII